MRIYLMIFTALAVLLYGCGDSEPGQAPVSDSYYEEHENWKQERIESLKDSTGWLRLAGMYWLEKGANHFGSGENNDVIFPEGTIAEQAGTFLYEDGNVIMKAAEGVTITHNGEQVTEFTLYDGNIAPHVQHGSLEWLVIVRDDITAIRLYNKDNPQADAFNGFPAYSIDTEWKREARFIPHSEETTLSIVNVLGQQVEVPSLGAVEFTVNGELYRLDAIDRDDRMFIIMADDTNRSETYQAGRYLYIDYPDEGNELTVIDFNKAYNPPCSFNKFTTCQLPPSQNRLDVAITAGEKRPMDWEGLDVTPD
jgi:uncharacterized protein